MSVTHCIRAMGHNRDIFSIFFDMNVCCVLLLESPHRDDSNDFETAVLNEPSVFEPPKFYCSLFPDVKNNINCT